MAKVTGKKATKVKTGAGSVETATKDDKQGLSVIPYSGKTVSTDSEEWRRYCEAVWVFKKYRTKNTRQRYLADVFDKRGEQGRKALFNEMVLIHRWKDEQ
jgi:hypothetical protein